jgi:DNA-directed RNA polymerase subunit L
MDVKELEYLETEYGDTKLILELEGKEINYTLLNSLRKISINQVPIYSFDATQINIIKNTSIYDGIYMRCRLSQLPIPKLNHNVLYLAEQYYKNVNFKDANFEKHPDDTMQIEYYINKKNNTLDKKLYITTNDISIKINGVIVETNKLYSKKFPILLIILKQNEEFECSMKANIAIGEYNSIYNASNTYYKEITDNKFILTIESTGQLDEYTILDKGIKILCEKYRIIKENIIKKEYKNINGNNIALIEITNEDYTCGGLLNYTLQNMENVKFSGIAKPTHLEKKILIRLKTEKILPLEAITTACDLCIEQLQELNKKIKNINQNTNKSKNKNK